jgi:spore germination protein KC
MAVPVKIRDRAPVIPPRKGVVVVGLSFKKKVLLLLLISWLLSQTGCWDHIEAEQLGIIGIIGLDQAPEGKLRVTLQIINPKALAGGGQTGGGGGASISTRPYRNISAEGNTIMECIRLLSLHAPSRLFFAHNQTILISEELARNRDIETIVDFFDRNQQFRRNNYVLVSRSDISSVIGVPGETQVPATQRIPSILRQQFLSSFYPRVRLGDFLENLECDGKDVYAMGIQVEPNEAEVREKLAGGSDSNAEDPRTQTIGELVKISGTAVFRGNRMAGWLNERESRGLLWVNGEVKGGVINVPCSLEQKPGQNITVAMEILRNKSKIEPGFIDGKLNIIVKIDTVVTIQEVLCMEELGQPEIIESLEEALVSAIQTEVEAALAKAQHEYQSDVFGFGLAVYRKYPDIWKELKPDWAEIYRNLPVYLEIDARISRTGLISKPVEVNH